MHLRLVLEYDGTDYHGWQVQPDAVTIQEKLEEAIRVVTGRAVRVRAAGRTDAGVHALGQVVDFRLETDVDPARLRRSLNGVLPRDIAVLAAGIAPPGFNAKTWAREKTYRYVIANRPARPALRRRYAWHVARPLDLAAMRAAAAVLVGRHDFSAFRAADCPNADPVKTLSELMIEETDGGWVAIEITASGFLKQMARAIVGTLVEVGLGERTAASVAEVLAAGDRTRAGPTAPARGLFLVRVRYDDGFGENREPAPDEAPGFRRLNNRRPADRMSGGRSSSARVLEGMAMVDELERIGEGEAGRRPDVLRLLLRVRKLSLWLATLAARRTEFREGIAARVRAEYEAELEQARRELATRGDEVRAFLQGREKREQSLALLLDDLRQQIEEADLRRAVGELSAREHEAQVAETRERIAAVEAEIGQLDALVEIARGILEPEVPVAEEAAEIAASEPEPAPPPPIPEPEPEFVPEATLEPAPMTEKVESQVSYTEVGPEEHEALHVPPGDAEPVAEVLELGEEYLEPAPGPPAGAAAEMTEAAPDYLEHAARVSEMEEAPVVEPVPPVPEATPANAWSELEEEFFGKDDAKAAGGVLTLVRVEGGREEVLGRIEADRSVVLGSGGGATVRLDHPSVAARHCRIYTELGEFVLVDQSGKEGTFVNGQRVKKRTLAAGDEIRLGKIRLKVRLD